MGLECIIDECCFEFCDHVPILLILLPFQSCNLIECAVVLIKF